MMTLLRTLSERWHGVSEPFMVRGDESIYFSDIQNAEDLANVQIQPGEVVALIGDFEPLTLRWLLQLMSAGVVIVPLTRETTAQHEYFFEAALVDVVISSDRIIRRAHDKRHPLLDDLRQTGHGGIVFFSTGTTGRPKAILHDLKTFLSRFVTPRPAHRTLGFLLFDHVGGINTLLHTLFNKGVVVAPLERTVSSVIESIALHDVEVLPTTPTFLRLLLMTGLLADGFPECLRVITYGTERMDQPTLSALCQALPLVDFRQTFGMSELGILRVKSDARDSLFMKIGGEGVDSRVVDGVLQIKSASRMLGYLNASSPFDDCGWYDTGDLVEQKGDSIRVVGRRTEVINVGGLKFMASEVERVVLDFPGILIAKAFARENPITGQHLELIIQPMNQAAFSKFELQSWLSERLPSHMLPRRIRVESIPIGHRFKRA